MTPNEIVWVCRQTQFMTSREMSKALGVSQSFLSDVLSGRRKLSFKLAVEWAPILNRPKLPAAVLQQAVGTGWKVSLEKVG